MHLGEISNINIKKKEIRVYIYNVYSDNIKQEQYPIALLSSNIPLMATKGLYVKLEKGNKVICDFINNDLNKPIIIGFVNVTDDYDKDLYNKYMLSFTSNKNIGIHIEHNEDNNNMDILFDGNVKINKLNNNYKNLLTHLNDITDKINEMIDVINSNSTKVSSNYIEYNGHFHPIIPPIAPAPISTITGSVAVPSIDIILNQITKSGDYNDEFKSK